MRCACHAALFDLETGTVLDGPAEEPIRLYETRVADGRARGLASIRLRHGRGGFSGGRSSRPTRRSRPRCSASSSASSATTATRRRQRVPRQVAVHGAGEKLLGVRRCRSSRRARVGDAHTARWRRWPGWSLRRLADGVSARRCASSARRASRELGLATVHQHAFEADTAATDALRGAWLPGGAPVLGDVRRARLRRPTDLSWPEGIEPRPFQPDDARGFYEAITESFSERVGLRRASVRRVEADQGGRVGHVAATSSPGTAPRSPASPLREQGAGDGVRGHARRAGEVATTRGRTRAPAARASRVLRAGRAAGVPRCRFGEPDRRDAAVRERRHDGADGGHRLREATALIPSRSGTPVRARTSITRDPAA